VDLASLRIITHDVDRLVAFYEVVLGRPAARPAPVFAEFRTDGATLAIGALVTVNGFWPDAVVPAANRSVLVEFLVEDVDTLHAGLRGQLPADRFLGEPTTMPWGNRSALLRDPDGNLVNLFTRPAAAR
jgi:catechol 2,3-dioxygenase-like lactoylglutathione lyase family enzyme